MAFIVYLDVWKGLIQKETKHRENFVLQALQNSIDLRGWMFQ